MSILLSLLISMAAPTSGDPKAATPQFPAVPAGKVSTGNPRSLVAFLQEEGFKAKLITPEKERPYIESGADGATFFIYLQNCEQDRNCQDLMFRSSYDKSADKPVTIDKINAYNRDTRWARSYLDDDGGPVIEYDVLFTDQLLDQKAFGEALAIWSELLASFHKTIDY